MRTLSHLSNSVLREIKRSENLPKLPQTIMILIEACNRDDTQIEELIDIISSDPGLTARLMDIMASASVNVSKEIRTIETAVVYLGINAIRNLAISMAVMQVFDKPVDIPDWDINIFWYHSFASAVIAKKIAEFFGGVNPDEVFLAGLMHDIGLLLFLSLFPERYASILSEYKNENDILIAEKRQFKITRFEAGAWLCSKWNFNPIICDAILNIDGNKTSMESAPPFVKIVFAAEKLTDFNYDESGAEIFSILGMEEDDAKSCLADAQKDVSAQADHFGIKLPDINQKRQNFTQHNEISHQVANDYLKLKVKQASLIYGTIENLLHARTKQDILNTIDTGLKILFPVKGIFYFLYDDEKHLLTGCSHNNDNRTEIIKTIAIPLTNRKSLLIKSLVKKNFVSSSTLGKSGAAVSDIHIMRLMKAEEIFCFPILANRNPVGVMVIGISKEYSHKIIQDSGIIAMLAKLSAVCLRNIQYHSERGKFLENERLSAASDTTRRIIHEINNPLGIIASYLKILSLKLPNKHPAQKELIVINEEIDRISSLLAQLSDFAAPFTENFEFIDINAFLGSLLEIMKKTILLSRGIEVVFIPDTSLPRVKTCKNGLKQVIINLVKNAAEAMENGGEIDIITRRIQGSEKIMIDEKRKIPGKLEISIIDNGPGIPDEIKSRIFEPYNTSKKTGHSGLGLSIVKNIVTRINGTIECKTIKGRGTVFKITLPVS